MPNVLGSTAHPAARPARRRRDWRSFRLLAPALLLLVIFFLLPVLSLLLHSILEPTLGLQNYTQLLGSTTYLRVFGNTFLVATVVTVATVAIGFPTAWLLAIAPRKVSSCCFPFCCCRCGRTCWRGRLPGWYSCKRRGRSTGR